MTGAPARLDGEDLARLLLIRYVEQSLLSLFAAGQVSGTIHTCLGQEYVPVALAPLIAGDFVFSNHRSHGHYLALHDDPAGLLAEVLGREGAVCHGVGGSQHLFLNDRFVSTGIQGESLPVAVGVGLHLRRTGQPRLAVAFIGDGTWGEGAVYEALNMAQLWQVPLLVVVEHNGIAQTTPTAVAMAGTIAARASAFGIPHHRFDSDSVTELRAAAAPLLASQRRQPAPLILEFRTIRLGAHSKGDDTRADDELTALRSRDWAARYEASHPEQFREVDTAQRERVAAVVADVLARTPSRWSPSDAC